MAKDLVTPATVALTIAGATIGGTANGLIQTEQAEGRGDGLPEAVLASAKGFGTGAVTGGIIGCGLNVTPRVINALGRALKR